MEAPTKCNFCPDSKPSPITGKMTCPFMNCIASRSNIEHWLDNLSKYTPNDKR